MAAGKQFSSIRSVAENLAKGEELIICTPDAEQARLIAQVLQSSGRWKRPSEAIVHAKKVSSAIGGFRKYLRTIPDQSILLLDLSSPGEGVLRRDSELLELHEKLSALLRARGIRSVWLVNRSRHSGKSLGVLKDRPAVFADCTLDGSFAFCQFITAKRAYAPHLFVRCLLDLNDPDLRLEPVAPSSAAKQELYFDAFTGSPDGIAIISLNTGILELNAKARDMLGYASDELSALSLPLVVLPAQYRHAMRSLSALRLKRKASGILKLRRKSGRMFVAAFSASALPGARAVIIFRDVTDEAERLENERKSYDQLKLIADASPLPHAVFAARHLVFSNAAFRSLFSAGGPDNEAPTLRSILGKGNAELARRLSDGLRQDPADLAPISENVELVMPGGSRRAFTLRALSTLWEEKPAWHVMLMDVTERDAALRALRESERTYREVCERQGGAISIVQDGRLAFVNAAYATMFGHASSHELTGKDAALTVTPRDRKSVAGRFSADIDPEDTLTSLEYTGVRPDGTHLSITAQCVRIEYLGRPALLYHHTDMTRQRAAELELRREVRQESIVEQFAHGLHRSMSAADVMAGGLKSAMQWIGFEHGGVYAPGADEGTFALVCNESLPANIATTLSVQGTREGVTGLVCKTAEPLLLDVEDYPAYLPYRSLFQSEGVRSILYIPFAAGERVDAIMMLCSAKEAAGPATDKTLLATLSRHAGEALANAQSYNALQTAERMYHTAVESVMDVVYQSAASGAFLYVSPQVERLTGYRSEEFVRRPDLWRTLLHPDDRAEYSRRISNQGSSVDEFETEYRLMPKGKASYRWVRDALRYRREGGGTVSAIYGLVTDITVRKEAERTAASGESFRADVLESVQEGMVVYDKDLRYREWNRAMELLTGFSRGEVIGKSAFDDGPQFQLAEFEELLHRALAGTPVSSEDVRYTRAGSEDVSLLWCRFSPLRERSGAISGVVVTFTDVTHRKNLEHELRESEETLRNVIDTMGDALMISDLQGKVWEVNREFSALTGYARGEVIGMTFPYPWLIEEQMSRFVVWLAALRERRFLRDFDMTWRRQKGQEVPISLNTTLLRNALGEPVAMLNIARDITERRRLATELTTKGKQIEMVNRIISKANSTMDFPRIFESIAEEVGLLMSFDHMNVALLSEDRRHLIVYATAGSASGLPAVGESVALERCVSKISVEAKKAVIIQDIAEDQSLGSTMLLAEAGMHSEISIPIMLNEQVIGTFNINSAVAHRFLGEELSYLQPIADQIGALIDRTQLFRRVSEDSAYIHNLLNSIESVVFTVDRNSIVREVNTAWREFALLQGTAHLREESSVIGRPLEDIVPFPSLRHELKAVTARLFDRTLNEYVHELPIGTGREERVFQLVVTPLAVGGTVTGLVFTWTDITESKRTEAEIKRRNEELLALNAIASSINKSLDPKDVLAVASEQLRGRVQADIVLCYLRTEAQETLHLAAYDGISESESAAIRSLPVSGSVVGQVVQDRRAMMISSTLAEDPRVTVAGKAVFLETGVQSFVAIPLESHDRVLGALVAAFKGEHAFTDQEQRFLHLVGNQVGSALANVQLYSEVQSQVRRITLLYEIGRGLTGALDMKTIFSVVHDGLKRALPFESFFYFTSAGPAEKLQQFARYENETVSLTLSTDDPGILLAAEGTPFAGERKGGGSLIAVPLRSKGNVIGVLALAQEAPNLFLDAHLRLLESIANLTEIAVDRAILYEDTVAKSEEIEARNRELDDFTYVVSHDLKEPLITIEGYSKIVLNDYRSLIDEEGKSYLNSLVQSSQRMKNLIDDVLTLSRLGRLSEMQETLPLGEVITEVLHDFEFTLRNSSGSVRVQADLPSVRYNRTQLGMVFRNLIANAIKFNRSPEPLVEINVAREKGEYTVSVRDNGIGIERNHYDRIFVVFQRLHRTEDFRGTGAGLTIVKKIVENHHGRIWLDSVVGQGTTFYFTIPETSNG